MRGEELVSNIVSLIPKKRIFLLEGELGAGKTFLVKKICKALKIKEPILSPTFILWQKYEFKIDDKKLFLNHLDLYRVRASDILKIGLRNELFNKNNIFLIEWGEKLKRFLKKNSLKFVVIKIIRSHSKRSYLLKNYEL
ncbi:MAG: tRNA (adenosine(37)-N6)-threonylcarbamoyltransferase complex ATPase subunit type 1 TsaE [Patescibacteria group bacterium]|nr:tRNA (adenosine(37)-N6)-threonylcarbamoyltransferase complex ATPase subunit type 1 TsaE [Patescibacteria group bacterium]